LIAWNAEGWPLSASKNNGINNQFRTGEFTMQGRYLASTIAALLFIASPRVRAQAPVDVSGHWEGAIRVPGREIAIEIDFGKDERGALIGAFNNPAENLSGFPLSNVGVDGRSVRFELVAGAGGGPFKGVVSPDGKTIEGDFTATTPQGPVALPIALKRTGEARIEAPPINAPVGKDFEGAWQGSIDVNGNTIAVALTLTNHPDGTSTGTASASGGNALIPITTISQQGRSLTLEMKIIGGVYKGTLSTDGFELTGTWQQGSFEASLTFHRAQGSSKI
jgi:hypothetical protein